jgi:hypothetical protein
MTLLEIVQHLTVLRTDGHAIRTSTIYVLEPWAAGSAVIVSWSPEKGAFQRKPVGRASAVCAKCARGHPGR